MKDENTKESMVVLMDKLCLMICCVAIILLLVITLLDLLGIPKQLKRIADALEQKQEKPRTDPCETCLRWSECNGVDRDDCPMCR